MKLTLMALSLMFSLQSFAKPQVGDYVRHLYTSAGFPWEASHEITAYNDSTQEFTIVVTISDEYGESSESKTVLKSDLIANQQATATAFKNCGFTHPQVRSVKTTTTTAAGTFDTCSVTSTSNGATSSIAPLPFEGIVKLVTTDMMVELQEYRFGSDQ